MTVSENETTPDPAASTTAPPANPVEPVTDPATAETKPPRWVPVEELASERAARRAAEAKVKEFEDASRTDAERLAAKAEAAEALVARLREQAVRGQIQALAATKFADPTDAERFLDPAKYITATDEVDAAAIADDIAELLKSKPHLAAERSPRFAGTADGGARNGARPQQLTRADLASMTTDQIEAARLAGRLDDLQGIKR